MLGVIDAASKPAATGTAYALAAYGAWGLLPLYWRALHDVPAPQILAHRIAWSLVFVLALVGAQRWSGRSSVAIPRARVKWLALSGSLLALNWLLYIWAVNAGFVLETSLGYFINPLVNVVLGRMFLGEELRSGQQLAVGLAAAGVLVITIGLGVPPFIALLLAVSFGLYGLIRKLAAVPPLTGLAVETATLAPVAALYLGWLGWRGEGALGGDVAISALLVGAGVITALPLIWFGAAASRLRLGTLGFFQYLAPTLQFLLAITVFGEALRPAHVVGFALIWTGLAVYASDAWRANARLAPAGLR